MKKKSTSSVEENLYASLLGQANQRPHTSESNN
jgi:hypothetical protein